MYEFLFDDMQFPVAPESLKIKIKNQNQTMQLISGQEINIPKAPGLFEFEFTLLLPGAPYPFAVYPNGFKLPGYYLEKIKELKQEKKGFRFIVNRKQPGGKMGFDTNMSVALEEYSTEEDAKEGFDVVVNIKLKQYEERVLQPVKMVETASGEKALVTEPQRPAKEPERTYTVKKGDKLYDICKKELGNGNLYPEIAKLNGIANPSQIKVGQVIRFA